MTLWKVCRGVRDDRSGAHEVIQSRLTLPEAKALRDETKSQTRPEKVVWVAIDRSTD